MILLSSKKELEVMEVLWNADKPLAVSGIVEANPSLNRNTLNIVLKKLHDAGYIYLAEYAKTRTVTARAYRPALGREECLARELGDFDENKLALSMVSNVLEHADKEEKEKFIRKLENMIVLHQSK